MPQKGGRRKTVAPPPSVRLYVTDMKVSLLSTYRALDACFFHNEEFQWNCLTMQLKDIMQYHDQTDILIIQNLLAVLVHLKYFIS